MNKVQQRRTSKKDSKLLGNIFAFIEVPANTLRVLCLFGIIPLSQGSADSVDQSTDGVCRSNLPPPFQASQYPNGVLRDEYGSVRLTHAHFLVVETRPVPYLCGLNRPAPSGGNTPLTRGALLATVYLNQGALLATVNPCVT